MVCAVKEVSSDGNVPPADISRVESTPMSIPPTPHLPQTPTAGQTADGERDAPVVPAPRWNRWLVVVGIWFYRALFWSLRIRVENPDRLRQLATREPHIFIFWHNRLLLFPALWHDFLLGGRQTGAAMISTSRDGELITRFLDRFGLTAVRGSTNRRGSGALRELVGWLKRGYDVGITPDGSRGPCYEIKPGLVLLAQLSGRPLQPISLEYSSAWRTKSWDRFFVPKPFSRVTFILGEPLAVRRTANPEEFEAERQRCEQSLLAMVRQR